MNWKKKHLRRRKDENTAGMHHWYYNLLVRRPCLMVLAISVLSLACIIVSFTTRSLPDFSEPTLGFEARGTKIGRRLTAWKNLNDETGHTGQLVANPNDLRHYHRDNGDRSNGRFFKMRKRKNGGKRKRPKKMRKNKGRHNNVAPMLKYLPNGDSYEEFGVIGESHNFTDAAPAPWDGETGVISAFDDSYTSEEQKSHSNASYEYGRNATSVDEKVASDKTESRRRVWRLLKEGYIPPFENQPIDGIFCDAPQKDYSHFVVQKHGDYADSTLFDLHGLFAICQLQDQVTSVPSYEEFCQRDNEGDCCRPWSLPNYVALMANKSSCYDLTTEDVDELRNLLVVCYEFFYDMRLSDECNKSYRCQVPPECTKHNAIYHIFQFMTDINFMKINESTIFLKYSMIFVPVARSTKILPLFHEWDKAELQNDVVKVSAMDLGLENELFNECLLVDSWLVALGGVFIMTCIWLYTSSLFVTAMTCVAVLFSLGLAYFVYTLVFELSFFPYMNLLAVVVIIGIGADDAFVFVKVWQCVLAERFTKVSTTTAQSVSTVEVEHTETLQNIMALTFRHAALSMLVTSFTTAVAFYASYMSSITAIKCFGVFAGTVVLTNYLLMITWLPASVSIMERISTLSTCSQLQVQRLLIMFNKMVQRICISFERVIVDMIMKFAPWWIAVFASVGVACSIVVLYRPGLQLPDSAEFQLFRSDHPFEVYNFQLKQYFWFEKSAAEFKKFRLPLRFVWGIQPIDDGDYTNPYSHGNLHYDNTFNMSSKEAQVWLFDFCQKLRQQSFVQTASFGMLLPNCFIENFRSYMGRRCIDGMDGTDRTPCCEISRFPYEPHIFERCLPDSISSLYATPLQYFTPGVAGPKFLMPTAHPHYESVTRPPLAKNYTPQAKVLVIEFESNAAYTTSYHVVKRFVTTVDTWFSGELRSAPASMQGGWFTSELHFFDVQDTLSHGTVVAIGMAMIASLLVVLLVTLNVLVSVFAVVTVSFTIFTTVAILILLGWKLNVLESVTVSSAIGLAVDFSLHYGIHYRLSPINERLAATQFALTRIIGPTVMAALTTGLAGALMLASSVLPYIQIGAFLVIVMTVSWMYATFFLMSLLRVLGPQYGFMQFHYPSLGQRSQGNSSNKYYERKPCHINAAEQLLTPSSSAVGDIINSETHELESLTSNSLIKTISGADQSYSHSVAVAVTEHAFMDKGGDGAIERPAERGVTTNKPIPSIEIENLQLPGSEFA